MTENKFTISSRISYDLKINETLVSLKTQNEEIQWELLEIMNYNGTPWVVFKDDPWDFRHRFSEDHRMGSPWVMRYLYDRVNKGLRKQKIFLSKKDRAFYRRPEYLKSGISNRISPSKEGWELIDHNNIVGGTFKWEEESFIYKPENQPAEEVPVNLLILMIEIVERRKRVEDFSQRIRNISKGWYEPAEQAFLINSSKSYPNFLIMEKCLPILSNFKY